MIKKICITSFLIFILNSILISGQGNGCPKIKVGVRISEVYPEVFDHLNKVYKTEKHRAIWLTELGELLMKSLRENSPDLEFIYLSGNPNADYDYLFSALFALSGGGEDVIVIDEYYIIDGENIFTVPPVYGSEYTVYKVWTSLIVNSNCFPNRRYILGIGVGESQDIYRAILSSLSEWARGIDYTLYKRENERPVPPREPQVETRLEKEYLSPLDEDTRKMKIYEKVLSCNGRPSYFVSYHSQPVRFPVKTDRGKIDRAEKCLVEYSDSDVQYILVNQSGEAVGEYKLVKGLEPLLEKITLSTCPLGNKPNIEKEVEIVIRGLELQVEPDRSTIYTGEQTSIQIDLHETDPDGNEYLSCDGREVEVKVTGLVDGTISHKSGKITLNEVGVAFINYKAGQQDKQIKISATFTPPGYPDEAKGEATITVKPLEYEASLTIKGKFVRNSSSRYLIEDASGVQRGRNELNELQEASFYVPLEMERSDDMPIFNQRWEYYRPSSINLTSCNIFSRQKKYDYASYKTGHGFEQTMTRYREPLYTKIAGKETIIPLSNIILIIDKETNKVVKIITGGYAVEFFWHERYQLTGRQWSDNSTSPISESDNKTDDVPSEYTAGPVEDEIPDPTIKSVSQSLRTYFKNIGAPLPANIEIPEDESQQAEIAPDLLVEFGDGRTFFGGDGKVVLKDETKPDSRIYSEKTFYWQITRKKK